MTNKKIDQETWRPTPNAIEGGKPVALHKSGETIPNFILTYALIAPGCWICIHAEPF